MKGKLTLVLGASLNENRYSNKAIKKLIAYGNSVVGVGLKEGVVLGVQIFKEIPETKFDTITLYLSPERQSEYFEKIISMKPCRVIFNPGTENPLFYKLLDKNGIEYVEACTLVMLSIGNY